MANQVQTTERQDLEGSDAVKSWISEQLIA